MEEVNKGKDTNSSPAENSKSVEADGNQAQEEKAQDNEEDEPASKRIGKESKEMFTLTKTGKVKKTKEK